VLVSKNNFLVEVDSQFVQTIAEGFFIDTDFNPKLLSTKIGKIHAESIGVLPPNKYETKLNLGDTVVFGHNVCQKKNKVAENIFRCPYHAIFARIDDLEIIPLEDIFFCDPIKEEDKNIGGFIVKGSVSNKKAKVYMLSKAAYKAGLEIGDIIYFTKDADYAIDILDKRLFMMRIRNVIGIERNGELKTFRNKLLVKNLTKLGTIGEIKKIYFQTSLQIGEVIESGNTGIEKGTILTYYNGPASIINWNGQDYAFIDERNIKYIIENNMAKTVLDRIIIKQDLSDNKFAGLEIPDSERKKISKGTVMIVGPGGRDNEGRLIPMTVKVGDKVAYNEHATATVDIDGEDYIIIREGELEIIY